jgi:hypothetical protein
MQPTEAIAGRPSKAHRCLDIAIVLAIETRIAVAIVPSRRKPSASLS